MRSIQSIGSGGTGSWAGGSQGCGTPGAGISGDGVIGDGAGSGCCGASGIGWPGPGSGCCGISGPGVDAWIKLGASIAALHTGRETYVACRVQRVTAAEPLSCAPPRSTTPTMTDLPDRLSQDPRSPFHDAELLGRGVGIKFNGQERTNVEEYCISEGWIRVAAGKALDRRGQPMTMKIKGRVEPYLQGAGTEPNAPDATDAPAGD
jgi:hypothetical protein